MVRGRRLAGAHLIELHRHATRRELQSAFLKEIAEAEAKPIEPRFADFGRDMGKAETAAGKYPVQAVSLMDRIIFETEADELYVKYLDAARLPPEGTTESAITVSARVTAQTLKDARAIVSYTMSGATASRVSQK